MSKDETSPPRKESLVLGELAHLRALREESGRNKSQFREATSNIADNIRYHAQILKKNPRIAVYSILVFAVLCACGLSIVFFVAKNVDEANELHALDLATETGKWFCKFCKMLVTRYQMSTSNSDCSVNLFQMSKPTS